VSECLRPSRILPRLTRVTRGMCGCGCWGRGC